MIPVERVLTCPQLEIQYKPLPFYQKQAISMPKHCMNGPYCGTVDTVQTWTSVGKSVSWCILSLVNVARHAGIWWSLWRKSRKMVSFITSKHTFVISPWQNGAGFLALCAYACWCHVHSTLLSTSRRRQSLNVLWYFSEDGSDEPTAVGLPFPLSHAAAWNYITCQLQMAYNCMKRSTLQPSLSVTHDWSGNHENA